jgi:hypothetical protein
MLLRPFLNDSTPGRAGERERRQPRLRQRQPRRLPDALGCAPPPSLPGDGSRRHPTGRADAAEANIPQLPAHVCQARFGERRADHLALTAPRPLRAEGDDRHLRPLGTRRTQAPGSKDGGCLPGLMGKPYSTRTPTLSRALQTRSQEGRFCRHFCDGPGRDRTCDLGIKSPLLYQLSYRPAG